MKPKKTKNNKKPDGCGHWLQRLVRLCLPTKVEAGQVWEYVLPAENPWDKSCTLTHTVIDVKEGWVKYLTVTSDGLKYRDPEIRRVDYFKRQARLVCVPNAELSRPKGGEKITDET
ncbi:MAG: hypothetical protein IPK22_11110 [Verrucomicrobiaceae bacterium]|nr:hypothetical protein [Verrucomicrobiaceae bacterium]